MPRIISIISVLIIVLISSFIVFDREQSKRQLKEDLIELSKAKYGVFNVDEWKVIVTDIITKKIDEFRFDPDSKKELEKKISDFLYQAIDAVEESSRASKFTSIKSFFQNAVTSTSGFFNKVRDEIPELSKNIVADLEKPETREALKKYISDLIGDYADRTFSDVDYSELNAILSKYDKSDKSEALIQLRSESNQATEETFWSITFLYAATILMILIMLFVRQPNRNELSISLIACLALLILGLTLPMIDIDARIDRFSFKILGEPIDFKNQVLYFKSKSILEVVVLMITQGKLEVVFVGLLVFAFSVLFPFTKLIASILYLLNTRFKSQGWVKFFVFKSGKWSMADVMVVAIFMAYIGFTSILSEQLKQLDKITDSIEVLTTNQSTLNTGFFMFFGFVLLGLVVSNRINSDI